GDEPGGALVRCAPSTVAGTGPARRHAAICAASPGRSWRRGSPAAQICAAGGACSGPTGSDAGILASAWACSGRRAAGSDGARRRGGTHRDRAPALGQRVTGAASAQSRAPEPLGAGVAVSTPAGEACPLCGGSLDAAQDWCLRCGAAARTRLAASPNWKAPAILLAVVVVVALAVLAAAVVKLAGSSGAKTITRTLPAVAAPAPTTTAPPSAGATGGGPRPAAPGPAVPGGQ